MRQFYNITKTIKDALEANSQVNVVTFGDIFDIDLNKQTIFPLAHIMVNSATIDQQIVTMNISVVAMDIVDVSKVDPRSEENIFYGNNNEHDVLNTQLAVINSLTQQLSRGTLYTDLYQLSAPPTCVPFTERFENLLAGWTATFDIILPNTEVSVC